MVDHASMALCRSIRIDAHCHTCVGCALIEALLEQGQHLTHGCRQWKVACKMGSIEPLPHEKTTFSPPFAFILRSWEVIRIYK
mgnify:CR=1 FL=1